MPRAIIRVILPVVTDEKAMEIKALVVKALENEVVTNQVEMSILAR